MIKQVKIIYKTGIPQEEQRHFTQCIRQNTLECMAVLLDACERYDLKMNEEHGLLRVAVKEAHQNFSVSATDDTVFTADVAKATQSLWQGCPQVQQAYARKSEFWLLDGCPYYMTHALRFADPEFKANDEDQIMARVRTTGISITEFMDRGTKVRVVVVVVEGVRLVLSPVVEGDERAGF